MGAAWQECLCRIPLQFEGHDVWLQVLTVLVMNGFIFLDITPSSPLKVNRRFGGTYCLHPQGFTLVSYSAYSSTLKMEATCSSETSVDFQLTTRRYIPEDRALNNKTLYCTQVFVNIGSTTPISVHVLSMFIFLIHFTYYHILRDQLSHVLVSFIVSHLMTACGRNILC
jgi:hypothetical protein